MAARTRRKRARSLRRLAAIGAGLLAAASLPLAAPLVAAPAAHAAPDPGIPVFTEVATFYTAGGGAEILAGNTNGDRVLYTDAGAEEVGAVGVADPANPVELWRTPVDGEPTSVALMPSGLVAAAVVHNPSTGSSLVALRTSDGAVLRTIPLSGQPDSVAVQPAGKYLAVAIENEETAAVPGEVAVIDLPAANNPATWSAPTYVSLTGLASINPDDPEPEFIDIRGNHAVVSLQENNHLAQIHLPTKSVTAHWSAGTVSRRADTATDKEIALDDALTNSPRIPDAVGFHPAGYVVTANEGEANLTGGRGFSVFSWGGSLLGEYGESYEVEAVRHGHYPDTRSNRKGTEAEGIEFGVFGGKNYAFVGAERGAFVNVYQMRNTGQPEFLQLLPTGTEPEGLLAMSQRGLFLTANEADGSITVFQAGATTDYPDVASATDPTSVNGDPIPWSALSGLASGPGDTVFAVPDNAFGQSRIWTMDTAADPAVLNASLPLAKGGAPLMVDPEGLATRLDSAGEPDPSLGWWLASEGGTATSNELFRIDGTGAVTQTVTLPPAVANEQVRWGFEGVTVTGSGPFEQVYVAFQREWLDDAPGMVRIGRYTPIFNQWDFFHYPLDVANSSSSALEYGLSEIVALSDTSFAVVERDSRKGPDATIKKVYGFTINGATPTACSILPTCPVEAGSVVTKTPLFDLLGDNGYDFEKVEGMVVNGSGELLVVNDNDGAGETRMLRLDGAVLDDYAAAADVEIMLTILHNNDGESKLQQATTGSTAGYGGVAHFASVVDDLRAEADTATYPVAPPKRGTVMLSSGDNFLAGAQFGASLDNGVPFYDGVAMDLIGYDAAAIGNHEFDFGPDTLADMINSTTSFPWLSSNLDVSAEPNLDTLATSGRIAGSTTVVRDGETIGIVGATTPRLPFISSPRNVVVDDLVATAIQNEVDSLEATGVDKIILIAHLQDLSEDLALLPQLSGIDVAIAGGGDELLADPAQGDLLVPGQTPIGSYPATATNLDGEQIPVITVPGGYLYAGRLTVGFDAAGELVLVDHDRSGPVRVAGPLAGTPDAVPASPAVQAQVVDPVNSYTAALSSNVVATTEVDLDGRRSAIRVSETNEGDLVADSLLWQANQLAGSFGVAPADVALQNAGGIRNDSIITSGSNITELDTYNILAFLNFATIAEVPRDQLKELVEHGVARLPSSDGRFPQIAGMTVTYDLAGTGQVVDANGNVTTPGTRIVDIELDDGTDIVVGGVVQAGAPVRVATIDFLGRGGDLYPFRGLPLTNLGVTYQQALVNYLEAPVVDGGLGGLVTAARYPVGGNGRLGPVPPAP
ncbi:MAG: esterase-like activity of phytase family protein [Acidimicrobiales bacterium]|jgi:5'-nucleotidase|nr:esterase-like activity of phytase family protein [Acidimicrobiales bacterium]